MDTLQSPQIAHLLQQLHQESDANYEERYQILNAIADPTERKIKHDDLRKTAFMSVSSEEGRFLHFLAKYAKAKTIVEFGCSFGISTIYLAAAAKDNGGSVISSEIETSKIIVANENISKAGLSSFVSILEGDATKTLNQIKDSIDFLFLDGAKDLYLPIFHLLKDKLRKGAIVFADNIDKAETTPFANEIMNSNYTWTKLFNNQVLVAYIS